MRIHTPWGVQPYPVWWCSTDQLGNAGELFPSTGLRTEQTDGSISNGPTASVHTDIESGPNYTHRSMLIVRSVRGSHKILVKKSKRSFVWLGLRFNNNKA